MNKYLAWFLGLLAGAGAIFYKGKRAERKDAESKRNKANAEQAIKTQRAAEEGRRKADEEIDKANNSGDDYFNNDRM